MKRTLKMLALAGTLLGTGLAPSAVLAQDYPTRPIRLMVGFPAGGSTDLPARILANGLSRSLGQPVVVENRAGASGNIASGIVARAAPDGYTLMVASSSFAAAPTFFNNLDWDPVKNFTPISQVSVVPVIAVTTPSLGIKTPQELVSYSKARPGELNVASPGATTVTRLAGEQFKQLSGVDWLTVHHNGGPPAMQATISGITQVMFANISDVIAQINAGQLQPIAVTGHDRSAVAPDIPTFAEAGYPDATLTTWQVVVGPAGMPPAVVERLNTEIRKVLDMPETKAQFLKLGIEAKGSTSAELGAMLAGEVEMVKQLVTSMGEVKK